MHKGDANHNNMLLNSSLGRLEATGSTWPTAVYHKCAGDPANKRRQCVSAMNIYALGRFVCISEYVVNLPEFAPRMQSVPDSGANDCTAPPARTSGRRSGAEVEPAEISAQRTSSSTQSIDLVTAFFHSLSCRSRSSSGMAGSQRLSSAQLADSSPRSFQKPTASPAA